MRREWLVVGLLAMLGACAGVRQSQPEVGQMPVGLRILVENESGSLVRIYARVGSGELPLGRVEGGEHRSIRLPLGVSGTMTLVARGPVGQEGHVSEPFSLAHGQWMTWRLRDSPGASDVPRISTIRVFSCDESSPC